MDIDRPNERTALAATPSLFLSASELQALTGYRLSAKQVQWLISHGWSHEISAIGRPIVSRTYCEKRLGVIADGESVWMPHVSAIRRR